MYPILFQFGGFTIYAYGFFIAVGFVVGTGSCHPESSKSKIGISFEKVVDLFFYTVLSAIVGSRILFVLINFDVYRQNPLQIFKIWEGGLVFYGGLILAVGVALRVYEVVPIAHLEIGRPDFSSALPWASFLAGSAAFLPDAVMEKRPPCPGESSLQIPNSLAPLNVPLHPTQLYDAANGLAIFFFLNWMEKRKTFDGQIFWLFLFLYSITRFFIEMLRGDPRGFLFGDLLSTSQGIGILLAIFSLFMLFYLKKK